MKFLISAILHTQDTAIFFLLQKSLEPTKKSSSGSRRLRAQKRTRTD